MQKYYKLCDKLTEQDYENLLLTGSYGKKVTIRGVTTGEFRAPKKGEWFPSGAIPGVYKAFADMSGEYFICKLVRVVCKLVSVVREV